MQLNTYLQLVLSSELLFFVFCVLLCSSHSHFCDHSGQTHCSSYLWRETTRWGEAAGGQRQVIKPCSTEAARTLWDALFFFLVKCKTVTWSERKRWDWNLRGFHQCDETLLGWLTFLLVYGWRTSVARHLVWSHGCIIRAGHQTNNLAALVQPACVVLSSNNVLKKKT